MAAAFQSNAFDNDAFETGSAAPPAILTVSGEVPNTFSPDGGMPFATPLGGGGGFGGGGYGQGGYGDGGYGGTGSLVSAELISHYEAYGVVGSARGTPFNVSGVVATELGTCHEATGYVKEETVVNHEVNSETLSSSRLVHFEALLVVSNEL